MALGPKAVESALVEKRNRTAVRIDAVADYMPKHKPSANINAQLRAGLSFLVGGARSAVSVAPPPSPPPLQRSLSEPPLGGYCFDD